MQVTHTHRSSLTDSADGERSETIIPNNLFTIKENTDYTMEVDHVNRHAKTGRYISNFKYENINKSCK